MTEIRTTEVDLQGLLDVLGHNLYSTPMVALRELVQNAHDSCVRRRLEDSPDHVGEIVVRPDAAACALTIIDTGAGLTHDEIVKYLATIGSGYTRKLREASGDGGMKAGLIGQFGLGFLSALFVAERVRVTTTSYQNPDIGWEFDTRGGERYVLKQVAARAIGTEVHLELKAERFAELAEGAAVERLLRHYCALLPIPVRLGASETAVNDTAPPWRLPAATRATLSDRDLDQERFRFVRHFERTFEPLAVIPIDVGPRPEDPDAPEIRGVIWIQDGWSYASSDNRRVFAYVRGMLVADDARDLLPEWAGFCGCVLESHGLTPTASREDLQRDRHYRSVGARVLTALIDGLAGLAKRNPAAWRAVLRRHNEALLGACICDDRLFGLLANDVKVPTTEGDLPMTELRMRSKNRIYVLQDERSGSVEEVLLRATMVPVVLGNRFGALRFCQRYAEARGCEVIRLGTEMGNKRLFPTAEVDPAIRARLEALLALPDVDLHLTRFQPTTLPAVFVPDREVELKRRVESDEADRRIGGALLGLARLTTQNEIEDGAAAKLYVNLDAELVRDTLGAPEAVQAHGAVVLRTMAALMSRRSATPDGDIQTTLGAFSEAVGALIRGATSSS